MDFCKVIMGGSVTMLTGWESCGPKSIAARRQRGGIPSPLAGMREGPYGGVLLPDNSRWKPVIGSYRITGLGIIASSKASFRVDLRPRNNCYPVKVRGNHS